MVDWQSLYLELNGLWPLSLMTPAVFQLGRLKMICSIRSKIPGPLAMWRYTEPAATS